MSWQWQFHCPSHSSPTCFESHFSPSLWQDKILTVMLCHCMKTHSHLINQSCKSNNCSLLLAPKQMANIRQRSCYYFQKLYQFRRLGPIIVDHFLTYFSLAKCATQPLTHSSDQQVQLHFLHGATYAQHSWLKPPAASDTRDEGSRKMLYCIYITGCTRSIWDVSTRPEKLEEESKVGRRKLTGRDVT